MALKGKARLSLFRKGIEVHRVEKKNTITGYPQGLFKQGNFGMLADSSKLLPLNDNFFKSCIMTDVPNDPSLMMIAGNANIIAQCSNNAYSGDNLKRGSYNANESGIITGGYRHVMDWGTSQGNGTIASVCLCRPSIGAVLLGSDSIPSEGEVNEVLHTSDKSSLISEALQDCSIIDYEKEVAYKIEYSSGTITVTEYALNTKQIHLLGGVLDVAGEGTAHSISQTVKYFTNTGTASVSYTGTHIHLLTFVPNSNKIADYAISLSDWSCTETEHTYSGVSLMQIFIYGASQNPVLRKDVMPIIGDYCFAISTDGTKIYKMNLLGNNDADVTAIDVPATALDYTYNGGSVILPNGDWYKFPTNAPSEYLNCLYHHNGSFYRARYHDQFVNNTFANANSFNANSYGTIFGFGTAANHSQKFARLDTIFPYVSTVANLDEAVTKTADLTMKLQYEITEVTGG